MGGGGNYGSRLDNRQRGNASQLLEKYRALARDAQQAGDRVTAEYYLQYADHYYRVLGDYRDKQPEQGRQRGRESFDDDSAGYSGGSEDADGDDEDDGDDRGEAGGDDRGNVRSDDRSDNGRTETRGDDNRSNWREDRPNPGRDRNVRDGNREPRRENDPSREQREPRRENEGNRELSRDGGQREPRRDGDGNRDRQPWTGNRNRDGSADNNRNRDSNADNNRNAEANRSLEPARVPESGRGGERRERPERAERPERRPDAPRAAFVEPAATGEGPIPGLPGPATLRVSRVVEPEAIASPVQRTPRAPRREPLVAAPLIEAVSLPIAVEGEPIAPRRRGRPRKVVDDLPVEG